ncbi:MAG: glycosyltransferase family 9 protein [Pseudonocardiaceae bacterium]
MDERAEKGGEVYRRQRLAHPAADRAAAPDWAAMHRVLAIRPDNVGDVIMLTPALRALRRAAPKARLELLASPAGSALRPLLPDIDGLLTLSPSWQQVGEPAAADRLAASEEALVGMLAARGYDAAVAFTSPTQSPWPPLYAALLAGVGVRVGQSAEFAGALATHWVTPPPEHTHQVDRCLHLLASVGVPAAGRDPVLQVPASARQQAREVLPGTPFALLVPGASASARRYPAERFGAVAGCLAASGLPVLVTGTDEEQPLVQRVVRSANHPRVRALPVLDLTVLAAVVAAAAVAVTNNSGGMHLADALGTPVAVAWSGTELSGDMAPRAVPSALLGRPVSCAPCRQFSCPYDHECLDVKPEQLVAAALRLSGTPRNASPSRKAPQRSQTPRSRAVEEGTCPTATNPGAAR